jgi:hexosaminidase
MKKIVLFVFLSGMLFSAFTQAQEFPLLPHPQRIEQGGTAFRIDSSLYLHISDKIDSNLKHYVYWAGHRMAAKSNKMLVIDLHEDSTYSRRGTWIFFDQLQEPCVKANEGYRLEVNKDIIKICASTSMGAMRALETLTQLLTKDDQGYFFPGVVIEDKPDYPWRGLLIDVVRHFIPMSTLYRNVDAMAMAKMNVLHLHLTEDQGFRIESKKFPALHEKGSNGQYYTQAEMKRFVEYASDRGIRVIPEFDMPAHTSAWLAAYPEFGSAPKQYMVETGYGVFDPAFDPSNEKLYEFLDVFLHEMATVFRDSCVHIGGDEVSGVEWQNNSSIQQFMLSRQLKDRYELQAYFNQRVQKILFSCGKQMVGWDEVLRCKPAKSTVIQSWRGYEFMAKAMTEGYHVVRSNGYYLDLTHTAGEYYMTRIPAKQDTILGAVIGLEAAMWSELVDSVTIDSRIWPNAAAAAEIGWNSSMAPDTIQFYKRLISFSAGLDREGLRHESYVDDLIKDLGLKKQEEVIRLIASYTKPLSGYARHRLIKKRGGYNNSLPLNTIADMAHPTSILYLQFVVLVDAYRAKPNAAVKEKLAKVFNDCIHQYEVLQRALHADKSLNSWMEVSSQLAAAGRIGAHLIKNEAKEKQKIMEEINVLQERIDKNDGYMLSMLPVLKSWVEAL